MKILCFHLPLLYFTLNNINIICRNNIAKNILLFLSQMIQLWHWQITTLYYCIEALAPYFVQGDVLLPTWSCNISAFLLVGITSCLFALCRHYSLGLASILCCPLCPVGFQIKICLLFHSAASLISNRSKEARPKRIFTSVSFVENWVLSG